MVAFGRGAGKVAELRAWGRNEGRLYAHGLHMEE